MLDGPGNYLPGPFCMHLTIEHSLRLHALRIGVAVRGHLAIANILTGRSQETCARRGFRVDIDPPWTSS